MDSKFIAIGIGLLIQAGAGLWYIASVDSRVSHNNYQIKMMDKAVLHNSRFVLEWPSGSWLSGQPLPSDTRQDLKIEVLEEQVDRISRKLYNGNY